MSATITPDSIVSSERGGNSALLVQQTANEAQETATDGENTRAYDLALVSLTNQLKKPLITVNVQDLYL